VRNHLNQEFVMNVQPFVESQDLLDQPTTLKKRLQEDGYLFFRNLVDPEPLHNLLVNILNICKKHNWLLQGSKLLDRKGRADAYEGYFEFTDVYRELQKLEDFHGLPHHPKIISTLSAILGGQVFPHPRNIARVTLPGSAKMTTPSHQDYVFIQGSQEFYTVWFPLCDCPEELGGLIVARGSHKNGILPTHEAEGTGGLCSIVDDEAQEWLGSDFRSGDIIIFHSLTVHKAYPNVTEDLLRISCDFRYQTLAEPVVVWDTLRPHMQLHSWEDIYSSWHHDTYKYYWHQYKLNVIPAVEPWEVPPTFK
jgi:ectoine hydroxylase-related dioxygenase (phytanoyl-CoA dioxygenase family)